MKVFKTTLASEGEALYRVEELVCLPRLYTVGTDVSRQLAAFYRFGLPLYCSRLSKAVHKHLTASDVQSNVAAGHVVG